ncbi:unnamed protein product [Zymoseptoria tritici ST99CH_1A5]|uniref:Uncharacterized protein n=1 Tax=Zymoseptoria tritici ST99CH_1A5 TaxID=1276529 RepID=A0A1Y6LUK4_ZYMTR|nr:unnamed protein product [Zymoseptoria tritici ST99CH_1A5]
MEKAEQAAAGTPRAKRSRLINPKGAITVQSLTDKLNKYKTALRRNSKALERFNSYARGTGKTNREALKALVSTTAAWERGEDASDEDSDN